MLCTHDECMHYAARLKLREREREGEKQRDTETRRQRDRVTETKTEGERGREWSNKREGGRRYQKFHKSLISKSKHNWLSFYTTNTACPATHAHTHTRP